MGFAAPQRGVTLIELMIGIVIFSTLLGLAAPSFTVWLQNSQIRSAAESLQHGLQVAHATAIQRNTVVWFRLVSALNDSCTVAPDGANWVVSIDDPAGACSTAPSDKTAPRIVQSRSGAESSRNATVAAETASIGFNGLGRRVTTTSAATLKIDVANPTGGECNARGGDMRCLRLSVSVGGQIRMCDPAALNDSARGC